MSPILEILIFYWQIQGLIIKTDNARIVNVSSTAHSYCKKLNLDDLLFERDPTDLKLLKIYGVSKLCNILFTRELARKIEPLGEIDFLFLFIARVEEWNYSIWWNGITWQTSQTGSAIYYVSKIEGCVCVCICVVCMLTITHKNACLWLHNYFLLNTLRTTEKIKSLPHH